MPLLQIVDGSSWPCTDDSKESLGKAFDVCWCGKFDVTFAILLDGVLVRNLKMGADLFESGIITACDELETDSAFGVNCRVQRVFFIFNLSFHFHCLEHATHLMIPSSALPTVFPICRFHSSVCLAVLLYFSSNSWYKESSLLEFLLKPSSDKMSVEFLCGHGVPVIFSLICLCLVTYFPHLQQKAPGLPLGRGRMLWPFWSYELSDVADCCTEDCAAAFSPSL